MLQLKQQYTEKESSDAKQAIATMTADMMAILSLNLCLLNRLAYYIIALQVAGK